MHNPELTDEEVQKELDRQYQDALNTNDLDGPEFGSFDLMVVEGE